MESGIPILPESRNQTLPYVLLFCRLEASPSGVNVIPSTVEDGIRDGPVEASSNGTPKDSVSKSIYSSQVTHNDFINPKDDKIYV